METLIGDVIKVETEKRDGRVIAYRVDLVASRHVFALHWSGQINGAIWNGAEAPRVAQTVGISRYLFATYPAVAWPGRFCPQCDEFNHEPSRWEDGSCRDCMSDGMLARAFPDSARRPEGFVDNPYSTLAAWLADVNAPGRVELDAPARLMARLGSESSLLGASRVAEEFDKAFGKVAEVVEGTPDDLELICRRLRGMSADRVWVDEANDWADAGKSMASWGVTIDELADNAKKAYLAPDDRPPVRRPALRRRSYWERVGRRAVSMGVWCLDQLERLTKAIRGSAEWVQDDGDWMEN